MPAGGAVGHAVDEDDGASGRDCTQQGRQAVLGLVGALADENEAVRQFRPQVGHDQFDHRTAEHFN
ncbi:hypothetical protein [Massilia sp. PWRC2]|uniref:hypothetical protein n=1 Tax=Massilia sp. PWRC2 TaxID=2804626 RepID=UPI003CE6A1C7